MKARLSMLLVAILGVAVFVAGCGGGDGDPATVTTSSLSKAAFVKKANSICERNRNEILNAPGTLASAIPSVYIPAFESLTEEMRELGAPSGQEKEVEAFIEAMEEDTRQLEENQESIASPSEFEEEFKSSAAKAKQSGLARCTFYARFD